MAEHNEEGKWGEDYAADWLQGQGYNILARRWRPGTWLVDIDLVCLDPDRRTLVFVEVKTRSHEELVDPVDAVDIKKMKRIGRAADTYVKLYELDNDIRFDIITIIGRRDNAHPQLEHIKDAFNPLLI